MASLPQWHIERPFRERGVFVADQTTSLIAKFHGETEDEMERNARLLIAARETLAAMNEVDCPELYGILAVGFRHARAAALTNRMRATIALTNEQEGSRQTAEMQGRRVGK